MSKRISIAMGMLIMTALACPQASYAQGALIKEIPSGSVTVTDWHRQSVYNRADKKIGTVKDVLVDKAGKITALIVGVGGFLSVGEKDVAVPFDAVQMTNKNNKRILVMDAEKDALKDAPGYTYDRNATTWVPEKPRSTAKRTERAKG
jgi:sporulation protein YlmC with PRC-barrel domain